MADFAATISNFATRTKAAHQDIFRKSAERVIEEMIKSRGHGGNLPLDTGFLQASLTASTSEMPVMRDDAVPVEGVTYSTDGQVNLIINSAHLGETIYAGFVAAYARAQNYGFGSHPGFLFVELAAQRWQEIVKKTEDEQIARAGLN